MDTPLNVASPPTEKPETAKIEKSTEFRAELPPDPDEHFNDEERKRIVCIGGENPLDCRPG
ncbi:unnamed protein product [Penicillium palitans]